MPRESAEDTIKRMQAELRADLEAMRAKLVRAEPPGLRSPKTPLKGAAVAAPDAGAAKARAPCCERGVQTATSLPHTQRDILWTASGLDPVLEDEGETTSQEGVDDARGTVYDVDILVQDSGVTDVTYDARDEPMMTAKSGKRNKTQKRNQMRRIKIRGGVPSST